MLLCRRLVLLHRGMGDCESPMSCLIICLDAVIIPHFPCFDKSFIFWAKIISAGKQNPSVTLRVPAPLSGEPFLMQRSNSLP